MAKCILNMTGQEAKVDCGTDKVCRRVEAGIKGGIQKMRLLWEQNTHEEDWGFLLIDACNTFNEENCTEMLWAVQFEWPSGAQFALN